MLILVAVVTNARQIMPDEAKLVAAEFFSNSSSTAECSTGCRRITPAIKSTTLEQTQPYYVYNAGNNAGFVIVAGDNRVNKILGYSDVGKFDNDNIPPQLRALLEQYALTIQSLSETQEPDASWTSTNAAATEGSVLLKTANWGQGFPYNKQCPIIENVQAPTGCVATAMAIVMKYHNWPEKYDWSSMPIDNPSDVNSDAIAVLMSDIGKSVEMRYGATESSTNSENVRYAFVEDFNYSNAINQLFLKYLDFEMLSPSTCIQTIKNQIEKSQPCLFSGVSSDGMGHMFVCDGYEGDLIHINWGWNGAFNGYYALSLNNDREMVYTNSQLLLSEIKKDPADYSRVFIDSSVNYEDRVGYGLNVRNRNIKAGEPIQFVVTSMGAPLDFCGDITLALIDKDENIKELLGGRDKAVYRIDDEERARLSYTDKFHRFYWDSRWGTYYFEHNPSETDYVCVVAKEDGCSQWEIVPGTETSANRVPAVGNTPKTIHMNIINNDGARILMDETAPGVNCVLDENNDILCGQEFGISALSLEGFPSLNLCGYQTLYVCPASGMEDTTGEYFAGVTLSAFGVDEITIVANVKRFADLTNFEVALDDYDTLSHKLTGVNAENLGELTIHGKLSAQDLEWLVDVAPNLSILDISDTDLEYLTRLPMWLKSIELPKMLKQIYPFALCGKPLMNTLVLPESIDYIHDNAFFQSGSLTNIISLSAVPPTVAENAFAEFCNLRPGHNYFPILFVPYGSLQSYKEADGWKNFKLIVECDDSNVDFDIYEHNGYTLNLVSNYARILNFPYDEDVVTIPEFFEINNKKYQSLTLECKQEDRYELDGNIKVRTLTIPGTIFAIGPNCFSLCNHLTHVYINEGVEEIYEYAFGHNCSLAEIYLPSTLKLCHIRAFYGNDNLRAIAYDTTSPVRMYGEELEYAFEDGVYENAILYVPEEALTVFRITEPWCNFLNIQNYFGYRVASIMISPESCTGEVGNEIQLEVNVLPNNATFKDVTFISSSPEVATVSATGLVKLNAKGSATIRATASDGSGIYSECQVIVNDNSGTDELFVDKNTDVRIYSTTGNLIYEGKYSLANLSKGVYMVVINGISYKQIIQW